MCTEQSTVLSNSNLTDSNCVYHARFEDDNGHVWIRLLTCFCWDCSSVCPHPCTSPSSLAMFPHAYVLGPPLPGAPAVHPFCLSGRMAYHICRCTLALLSATYRTYCMPVDGSLERISSSIPSLHRWQVCFSLFLCSFINEFHTILQVFYLCIADSFVCLLVLFFITWQFLFNAEHTGPE